MKRPLRPEETHIWAKVAATVRPGPGRKRPIPPPLEAPAPVPAVQPAAKTVPPTAAPTPKTPARTTRHPGAPEDIEPRRKRRIVREQDLGPRLDLHGLDQARAHALLSAFLHRAVEDGWRAVLVITGKGSLGDGVLRRMTPHWLAEPSLRHLVAGVSEAHRHHGGGGALYVALKRRSR